MKKGKRLAIVLSALSAIPMALAAIGDPFTGTGFSNLFSNAGNLVMTWLNTTASVYFFSVVLFFMLFYGLYFALLRTIKVFQEDKTLNRSGKLVAIALAGITLLGFFWWSNAYGGTQKMLEQFLNAFGWYGGFLLAILIFLLTRNFLKEADGTPPKPCLSVIAAGATLVFYGILTNTPWLKTLGIIMIIICAIKLFFGALGVGGGGGGGGRLPPGPSPDDPDVKRKKKPIGPDEEIGYPPNRVKNFQGEHRGDRIALWWDANEKTDRVMHYEVFRQRHPRLFGGWNRNVFGGWRRVAFVSKNYAKDAPFIDHESFLSTDPGIVRVRGRPWGSLDKIVPHFDYQYQIRAINESGAGPYNEENLRISRIGSDWEPEVLKVDEMAGKLNGQVREK